MIYVGSLCGRGTSACSAVAFLRLTSSLPSLHHPFRSAPRTLGPLCNWNSKSFLVWQFCKRNCRCLVFLRFHFHRSLFFSCSAVIRRKCFPLFPQFEGHSWPGFSLCDEGPSCASASFNFRWSFLRRVNRVDILRWEFRFPLQFSLSQREFPTLVSFRRSLVAFWAVFRTLLAGLCTEKGFKNLKVILR